MLILSHSSCESDERTNLEEGKENWKEKRFQSFFPLYQKILSRGVSILLMWGGGEGSLGMLREFYSFSILFFRSNETENPRNALARTHAAAAFFFLLSAGCKFPDSISEKKRKKNTMHNSGSICFCAHPLPFSSPSTKARFEICRNREWKNKKKKRVVVVERRSFIPPPKSDKNDPPSQSLEFSLDRKFLPLLCV